MNAIVRGSGIAIEDIADANRIFNKGRFGEPQSGGTLLLHPVEAAFLMENRDLNVLNESGESCDQATVLSHASPLVPRTEAGVLHLFHVYRDLRRSGAPVRLFTAPPSLDRTLIDHHLDLYERGAAQAGSLAVARITVFSEHAFPGIETITTMHHRTARKGKRHIFAVVDDDLTVTYFGSEILNVPGLKHFDFSDLLTSAEGYEKQSSRRTRSAGGKPLEGTEIKTFDAGPGVRERPYVKTLPFKEPFSHGDHDETDRSPFEKKRSALYCILETSGLIPRTGFKYGAHFRVYILPPEQGHAPYLVYLLDTGEKLNWQLVSRGVRLAHAVKKIMLFAPHESGESLVALVRIRP